MTTTPKSCPTCRGHRDKPHHLTCAACWSRVPKPVQDEVYKQYRLKKGSVAHLTAVRTALRAIHEAKELKILPVKTLLRCPSCPERPGEIHREAGVYSLCPPCRGTGYVTAEETPTLPR